MKIISRLIPFMVSFLILLMVAPVLSKTTQVTFENGMEVIFKENHSSPMITSIVFIRAGAKYESNFNNGVTHFLEHLLFDGTKNRSRSEISEGVENHGGYINAFTRKDLTAFLILMPSEYIEYGIEIQADQLFNSIFPEEELPKERKIVIEEIQKSNDNESNQAYYFFNAKSMAGTSYERPVLGYKNIISTLPRERVIEYWKQFYAPNNMVALVIGDFDTEEMIEQYRAVFGVIPPVNLPSPPDISYFPAEKKAVYKKGANSKVTYLSYGIDAPHFTDPDYFAFDMLAEYLGSDENSPIAKLLVDDEGKPLYQSFSVSLETAEEFSRLLIDVIIPDNDNTDKIIGIIDNVLENIDQYRPSDEILHGIKVSAKANEIFMSEKLHYYGFIIAPRLMVTGYDFLESYLDAIDKVNATMIVKAADRWLSDLKYTATVYYPKEVKTVSQKEAEHTVYKKEVLPNGLTVVIKSNPDSRVFALNVIGKNRTASEPVGKTGITDFVNRLLKKGTTSLNAEELDNKLASLGCKVTLNDNPWIPYDDRYTSRQFSFMKFETIDEFTSGGLELFADMIKNPAFDSSSIEQIRGSIMGLLGRQSGSTRESGRNLYYAGLFENSPYANSINGSARTIGGITRDDLIDYHSKFYSAGNMIITIGTNMDADEMMGMVKSAFGAMPTVAFDPPPATVGSALVGVKTNHLDMDKEQVYIYLGNMLPSASHEDVPAIRLATAILSQRLSENLREKQGLAYSVGAGATFDKNFGWYLCAMGTGSANFEIARDGILGEIQKLKDEGPTSEELEIAKNSLWGSSLTRNLSRINQAYYMGVSEYLGLGYDSGKKYIVKMREVTTDQVKSAAATYFDTENYILSTVGKL